MAVCSSGYRRGWFVRRGFSGLFVMLFLVVPCALTRPAGALTQQAPVTSWSELDASLGLLDAGPVAGWSGDVPAGVDPTGLTVAPDGVHAWVVGRDGGVFAFWHDPQPSLSQPSARFFGSLPGLGVVP